MKKRLVKKAGYEILTELGEYLTSLQQNGYVTFESNDIELSDSIKKILDVLNITYEEENFRGWISEDEEADLKEIRLNGFKSGWVHEE